MGGALKTSARLLLVGAVGLLMGLLAQDTAIKNATPPTAGEIRQANNNSSVLLVGQQAKVIKKSRASTVRVLSTSPDAMISSQTGTYVTMFERYFVITTAHGILGDCEHTKVLVEETQFRDCTRFIELNVQIDYVIMEVKEIPNLKAISIPNDLPNSRQAWLKDLSVMNRIFYTGYPNSVGPLTLDGHIAGYTSDDFIYLNSYAWSGSSGSGVFSQSGNYIGYILAIDVGGSPYGFPQVLEDIVLVVPAFKINWAAALDVPDTGEEVPEGEDTAN